MDVGVSESAEEGSAGEGGRASSNQGHFGMNYALIEWREAGIPHLLHPHLLEHLACKLLQLTDLDGSAVQPVRIARGGTQLTHRTESPAGEAEGVVGEDGLGCAVVVLILNLIDKGADVDADRAGLLTGTVRTLHAPRRLFQCLLLSVQPVVRVSGPISSEIGSGSAFEADAVLLAIVLTSLGVNYLRFGKLGSSGQHRVGHILGELGDGEPEQ